MLLLAAVLAGCGGSHVAPRVVPWIDEPLAPYRAPAAQLVRYPTSARPCDAAQLRLRNGRTGAALGNYLEELVVTNAGMRACLVRGYPSVTALDAAGVRVTLRPVRGGTYFGQLLPADIAPGRHVYLELATGTACQTPAARYRAVELGLPQGGTVRGPATSIVVQCGLSMSRVGLRERYAEPRALPGSAGALAVRLALPRTVRHGSLLRFTVVLRNPTPRAVALDPCPGYTQGLFAQQASVRETYRLNCKPLSAIPPRAQQRYAMQLRVPRDASGLAKIGWSLDTPTGPFAGGAVQVR